MAGHRLRRLSSLPTAEEASIDRLWPGEGNSLPPLRLLLLLHLLATMAAASGVGAGARRRADLAARAALRREGARVARAQCCRAALAFTAAGKQRPRVSDTHQHDKVSGVFAHLSAASIRVRARPLIGSVRLQSSSIESTTSWQFEPHPPAVPDTQRFHLSPYLGSSALLQARRNVALTRRRVFALIIQPLHIAPDRARGQAHLGRVPVKV